MLFFDRIFDLLLNSTSSEEQFIRLKSFDILANIVHSDEHRNRLANEDYLKRIYEVFMQP